MLQRRVHVLFAHAAQETRPYFYRSLTTYKGPRSDPSHSHTHKYLASLPIMVKGSDVLLIIVAILFPPAAAFFITGCSCDLLINVLLTCLGYFPGHIHAFWLIYRKMKAEETYGYGGYQYIGNGEFIAGNGAVAQPPNYGATGA